MGELIITGDRVLLEPDEGEKLTDTGLVLPASVTDREQVGTGRVVRTGPGYLTANPDYSDNEPWAQARQAVRYLPLQAEPGDVAIFLKKDAVEITYEKKDYLIVHHSSILALVRPDHEDILGQLGGVFDDEQD